MSRGKAKIQRYLWLGTFLLHCLPCLGAYVIPLHYWRGREELTIVVVLDKYYGRDFGDPLGLVPLLQKGKQVDESFVKALQRAAQEDYLAAVRADKGHYGDRSDQVAASVQQPAEISKAPNSGVYVYSKGKLIFSYRVVAPKPGKTLPVIDTYLKKGGSAQKIPSEPSGLTFRRIAQLPEVLRNGVWDLSHPPPVSLTEVYQSGQVEVKSLVADNRRFSELFPEVFNLTRWMLEYSGETVPTGTRYTDGRPTVGNAGAFTSNIFCDCYTDSLKQLYEQLGFRVWARDTGNGLPHYYLVATPESLGKAGDEVRRRIALHPGAALVEWDEPTMRRIEALLRANRGKPLPCTRAMKVIAGAS